MSDASVLKTISLVQAQVHDLEQDLAEKKKLVNELCKLAGRPPVYGDGELRGRSVTTSVRSDEFYGKPLATAVRMILEKRHAANLGAATVGEIYDSLLQGGYLFNAKNDENAKRSLYQALGKNTATFHKLPNGTYGLMEWYPSVKESRTKSKTADDQPEESDIELEDSVDSVEKDSNEDVKPKFVLPNKPR